MSEKSEDVYTPKTRFGDSVYDQVFDTCFERLWAPSGTQSSGWVDTLRHCISKHTEVFALTAGHNQNLRVFTVPSFAPEKEEEEEEGDDEDEE